MKLAAMYANRFLVPVTHYTCGKLRYKKVWIYYLVRDFKDSVNRKINKDLASVDPDKFANEKKYILFVLERGIIGK